MKLSVAVLTLASAWTAVHSLRADARGDHEPVPLQVNQQAGAREWRAPVVDKTPPSEGAGWAMQQKSMFAGQAARRESQGENQTTTSMVSKSKKADDKKADDKKADDKKADDKKANNKQPSNKKANDKKINNKKTNEKKPSNKKTNDKKKETKKEERETAHASTPLKKPAKRSENRIEQKKSKEADTKSPVTTGTKAAHDGKGKSEDDRKDKKGSVSHPSSKNVRHEDPPQGAAATVEDLYADALGDTLTNQYYNGAQLKEEARTVGAAVVTRMAESFRDETTKSLSLAGGIAGIAASVLGTVAAVVALFRQRSEFAEVELESDLPDLESGRVANSSVSATVVEVAVDDDDCESDDSESDEDDAAEQQDKALEAVLASGGGDLDVAK